MSAASGALTARLVLTGDAKGVVGAAEETVVALDQVKAKAAATGATVAGTTAEFDAAAIALKGQTDAAAKATAAITASTGARTSEVARLKEQGAAAESTIGKVRALSAAHAEYNGTIASARALVASKAMSEAQYAQVASAASAKLAADLAAVRVEASAGGMALDRLEANLAKLGRAGGVGRGVISRVRGAVTAVPEVIAAFPVVSAAGGVTAAIGVMIAAEQMYEASIGHLNVTLQTHGLALSSTNERYLSLAGDIASAAKTSTISAREMEASFANSHLDTSLWTSVAAMSRDYAAVLGTDVPTAAAKAAENLEKPYEWAQQLTQQYGLFDQATLKHIRDLEEEGKVTEAAKTVTDGWAERIKNAADQTSGWARAWTYASTEVSKYWDKLGNWLFGSKSEDLKKELANFESDLNFQLVNKQQGNKTGYHDDQIAFFQQRIAAIKAELKSIDPNTEKNNIEANSLSDMVNGMGLNSYDQKLRTLANERKRITDDYAKGIVATGENGKPLTQDQAVAAVDREITKTKKERADAVRSLNEVEKEHYERIQELLKGAPQLISQTELETKTSEGRARAYLQSSSALQAFNDAQEVAKATLPYTSALAWAEGNAHDRLAATIARVTKEKKDQLAADHALAAMQDVDQQVGSASGYMSNALADARIAYGRKQLDDWYTKTAADLAASGESWDAYHDKLDLIMGQKLANLYDEDLRNRTDWASGIERANNELTRSAADWASKSEAFITGWASTGEDAFVKFATTGKSSLEDLANFAEQQFAKMSYQRYLASSFNALGNMALNGIDKAFSGLDSLFGISVGTHHTGGTAGSPSLTRTVPAAVFYGAPRYHGGGDVLPWLQNGEVPIIAKNGERVQTEVQAARSDTAERAVAYISEMARPVVMMMPANAAAASGNQVPFEMHLHEAPGIKFKAKETTSPNGGRRVDVMGSMAREVESYLADRVNKRQGPLGPAIAATNGMTTVVR